MSVWWIWSTKYGDILVNAHDSHVLWLIAKILKKIYMISEYLVTPMYWHWIYSSLAWNYLSVGVLD